MLRRTILGSSWPRTCLTVPARKSSFSSGQESSECDAFSPSVLLSAEHRDRVVDRLRGSPALRHNPSKVVRQAAVLVPLCVDQQGEVCLAFQLRSRNVSHAGQVCFPGGTCDKIGTTDGDNGPVWETPEQAALRETREELGIPEADVDVWCRMPVVNTKAGETKVVPVLGEVLRPRPLDPKCHFTLSDREVEEAFLVPLRALASAGRYTQFRVPGTSGYSLPVFDVEPHRVWGMTAIMTFSLLKAMLPSKQYKHRLNFQSPIPGTLHPLDKRK